MKDMTIAYVVFMSIGVMLLSIWGMILSVNRKIPTPCLITFGFTIIFGTTIPLLTQGSVILQVSNISDTDIDALCDSDKTYMAE